MMKSTNVHIISTNFSGPRDLHLVLARYSNHPLKLPESLIHRKRNYSTVCRYWMHKTIAKRNFTFYSNSHHT